MIVCSEGEQWNRDKAAGKIARWGKLSLGGIVVYWLAEMNSD